MSVNKITLTYLNIRQSIAILLFKIVLADFVLALLIIAIYFLLVTGGQVTEFALGNAWLFIILFGVAGAAKIGLSIYIVLQWLNEYYEITPQNVVHKRGIIFKKTEMYDLDKVRMVEVQDSFLGEIFNFATVTLYEMRLGKYLDMYLIHNPERYLRVLNTLIPNLEIKKDKVSLPLMPRREEAI